MPRPQSPTERAVAQADLIRQRTVDQVAAVLVPRELGHMANVSPARMLGYYKSQFGTPDGGLNFSSIGKTIGRVGKPGYKNVVATMHNDALRQGYNLPDRSGQGGTHESAHPGQGTGNDLGQYP
jgi:hypothetical protein